MSAEDRIHKIKDFAELPWGDLDPCRCGIDWGVGRGGHGFDDDVWTLSVYQKDGAADVWELPAPLGAAFVMLKEWAAGGVRRDIRAALGIA